MPPAPQSFSSEPHRICVIGAGIGGLALAIRLQASGQSVTLIEARSEVGGCAGVLRQDGFRFDTGPGSLGDGDAINDLWALTGADPASDLDLLPLSPSIRFNWIDGAQFDSSPPGEALLREVARFAPDDSAGVQALIEHFAIRPRRQAIQRRAGPLDRMGKWAEALPDLVRNQAWRSAYGLVARFVKNEKLREALAFPVLLAGGNPFTTSAARLAQVSPLAGHGASYPKGGMQALADALARRFAAIGGTLRLGDPVVRIETIGNRVSEVETRSGWALRFDAVASNADAIQTYRGLLRGSQRGPDMARRLARQSFGPGMVAVHFGVEGAWPGIPHHSVLMGPRFRALFDDIFDHGVLPRDMLIMLNHPSVTDPAAAPPGKSAFTAMVPVPNLGKLPLDWVQLGPLIESRVLAEIGRRLIPDLDDRLVMKRHTTPRDWSLDLGNHLGSAFAMLPDRLQDSVLRPAHRDRKLANFYLVGAATSPGAGLPGVLAGAKQTARMMLEDIR